MLTGQAIISSDSAVLHRDLALGGGGGLCLPLSCLTTTPTLDPLFSQLLSVNVKAPFLHQICTDSCGTASFEVRWTPLTLRGSADLCLLTAGGGREQFDESGPALFQPV